MTFVRKIKKAIAGGLAAGAVAAGITWQELDWREIVVVVGAVGVYVAPANKPEASASQN
jgi:hypothetical protein